MHNIHRYSPNNNLKPNYINIITLYIYKLRYKILFDWLKITFRGGGGVVAETEVVVAAKLVVVTT